MPETEAVGRTVVTLHDVAALAGVSARTVSNVVNASRSVREQTRARVQSAIDQLGYRPNLAARGLRSGRSHVMGLALPSVTVPYFREFADAVLRAARDHGLSVLITLTHGDPARERAVRDAPRLRHADGILLVPIALGPDDAAALRSDLPLVVATTTLPGGGVDSFDADALAAARETTAHLAARGRRRIGILVPGDTRPPEHDERYRGYLSGLRDAGLPFDPRRVLRTAEVTPAAGAAGARALAERAPDTDALVCLGDALALGALRGLHDAGLDVPGDLAVTGFGNVAQAAHSTPTLTTVDSGREAMARGAVALLAARAEARAAGRPLPEPRHHTVEHRLVERESSARARP